MVVPTYLKACWTVPLSLYPTMTKPSAETPEAAEKFEVLS